jgi:diaminopimelate decarboxylase
MKEIGGCDTKLLADEFGTPLYVYDRNKIIENYNSLFTAFQKYYPKTKIHYSIKANSNLSILRIFESLGAGADCSSPVEVMLSRKAGFDDRRILYTGNYESIEDFKQVFSKDLKINLDDITSFGRLGKAAQPEIISFRINPGIGRGGYEGITTGGTDAKFGVPYEKAAQAYQSAKDSGIKRFGIHMMTGSNNLEPYYFAEIVEKLMKIAHNIFENIGEIPDYVDIGGGFGIPYEDDEMPLDLDLTAKLISEIFIEKCSKYGFGEPDLLMEPGRILVADAGYILSTITGIKKSYKNFVGIDAGMSTLIRPALYGAKHRVSVYGKNGLSSNVNICGQICENSDIFAKNVFLPDVEEGDIMIIRDAGAYGYVMSSNYNNRLRPAEVMTDNGKYQIIRRREKFEDVLALYE